MGQRTQPVQENYGRFDFVGKIYLFGGISLLLVLGSIFYLTVHGMNFGIDFAGGTEIQVRFAEPVTIDQVRQLAEKQGLDKVGVQGFGDTSEFLIRFQPEQGKTDKETNEKQNAAVERLRQGLDAEFAAQKPEIRRVDSVGPQAGAELKRTGILAVFYSLLVILIYMAFRFDFKYSPGAVICLFHDALVTTAIFVAVGKEVNIPVMASILTLIGYSLNDTIVIFDRIRENEAIFKNSDFKFIINKSINDTLSRTIITSATTFAAATPLFLMAGGTVSDIAFILCVGVIFGTYSTVYVAAPIIMLVEKFSLRPKMA